MKKLLTILGSIGLITFSGFTSVVSCDLSPDGHGDNNGKDDDKNKVDSFKELSQEDTSWDYTYSNKISYQKASEYYLNTANTMYGFIKGFIDEGKSDSIIWNTWGDYYFQSVIWYANEAQWDLVRADEFDGNYKYDQIDINSLTQDSYSKKWFQDRMKVLNTFVNFYTGQAQEIKNDGNYGIYAGGMSKALSSYQKAKQAQIDAADAGDDKKALENDMKFINNLTSFWENRETKIKDLNEKIINILANWQDN